MSRLKFWMAADAVAHFLYAPTTLGRRSGRARWHHRLHLIPGWLFRRICDAAERFFLGPEPTEEEFDEAMRTGTPAHVVVPVGYRCQHMSVSVSGGTLTNVSSWCGCVMEPIFPSQFAVSA